MFSGIMDGDPFLNAFNDLEPFVEKRLECSRCGRPRSVCICSHLPATRIALKRTQLHILQHPNEENRPLHTVSILRAALNPSSCVVHKGKKFAPHKHPTLHTILDDKNTFLLYPSKDAISLNDMDLINCNIVLIDGTWKQASSIFTRNPILDTLKKIEINASSISEYVIRTQPNDKCLSTVECAAIALSHTEKDSSLKEILLKPLRAMCQFQLNHGAVVHQSKEAVAKTKLS